MNSRWQINRVGLIDFWYYDEEEFYFLDGRMLLRGANGSGKSVTMQSFIPLLLDGNMRPERLDPFGSKARKMENYLLEEGDGREERTGYLYMELKREDSDEFLTLGIGMRARKNKKMDAWYFCITDGRRVGKDIWLYKDGQSKVTCTMRELRNRIGEGGSVMETQREYAQCVNRLLFGFETQEEYKELLDLLIQLRTPKLSKDFKPTVINEILSSSLQTLSEDDLRPMSEAIENMDNLKTSLDTLNESIQAAGQIEKVYDQYNQIVLYDKALYYTNSIKEERTLQDKIKSIEANIVSNEEGQKCEAENYESLDREEKILREEKTSLADSDAARLKDQEMNILSSLKEIEQAVSSKKQQEQEKKEKYLESEEKIRRQREANEQKWEEIEDNLDVMEDTISEIPFDEFGFMKSEILENREETYSFTAHKQLLKDYTEKVEKGKAILIEEKNCEERYSRLLQELDQYQQEKNKVERELVQYDNQLHEIKQEWIEKLYQWERGNSELHLNSEILQEISRRIEGYDVSTDYWEIRNLAKPDYDQKHQDLAVEITEKKWQLSENQKKYDQIQDELEVLQSMEEVEPDREPAVIENRKRLDQLGIPYLNFYKVVDFDGQLDDRQKAHLEEALLRMGILDALIIPEEYREQVLAMGGETCDHYIFTDAEQVECNLMELLDVERDQNDLMMYYNVSNALSAIGWGRNSNVKETDQTDQAKVHSVEMGSWIGEDGHYRMGALVGTITGKYTPSFIGANAREAYRQKQIQELLQQAEEQAEKIHKAEDALKELQSRLDNLNKEWQNYPTDQDLKVAAKELEQQKVKLENINERIIRQKELTEAARKDLDEIRMRVQEICQKCYLPARLDIFTEALDSLTTYRELLTELQILHDRFVSGVRNFHSLEEFQEGIEADLDDVRYDLNRVLSQQKEKQAVLASVLAQLKLTDYEKIKERLDHCTVRLNQLPKEKETSVAKRAKLENESISLNQSKSDTEKKLLEKQKQRMWFERAFEAEYQLGYITRDLFVWENDENMPLEQTAEKICEQYAGQFGSKKQSDLLGGLQEIYHRNKGYLTEYQMTIKTLFEEMDNETSFDTVSMKRIDIAVKYRGAAVKFKELLERMQEDAGMKQQLLSAKDRELFEDILANTISKKIRGRIQASKRWVEEMNHLMESMQTSSGLTLSLRWKNKRADKEEQLDTAALVALLQKDAEIMRPEEADQLSRHFRSKIEEARKTSGDTANMQSFHAVMREVLDYRKWFEFQLECQKTGEKKRELTDRVFFTFSGGEKAMAMYVPLFSAVVAKYAGARKDAPRLISLDEAFAGVDEMNIRDMFRLMVEFNFNFMINSQILWGDYDTVPGLAIYQLVRPENAKYVTVIRYIWNGHMKRMAVEKELNV